MCLFLLLFLPITLWCQVTTGSKEGTITFKSSKNFYVRFASTAAINIGDTLYTDLLNNRVPALIVVQKSSTSCVCNQIGKTELAVGQKIIHFENLLQIKPDTIIAQPEQISPIPLVISDSLSSDTIIKKQKKQLINGRLTFSTNASLNNKSTTNFQRIRTAFSMNVQNIHNSAFSAQTYITYRHRYGIDQTNIGFYDDFKIFSLALQYAPNNHFSLWAGRKINSYIANMGAIDGFQAEYSTGKYVFGAFGGTRPDFTDFRYNAKLPQFGAYLVRNDKTDNGTAQTSIAFAEQQNDSKTDRRFIYVQHNNTLIRNVSLFFSSELDMYKKVNGEISTQPAFTSMYISLRYKLRKNLSFSTSYDNRRNVIYYESYQTYIDQLLAQETRQGFRVQMNYNPVKSITLNVSSFYRYQSNNPAPTKNYVGNINFNQIPGLKMTVSLSANLLESYYFKGTILGCRLSENFLKGKINAEVNYRNVNYTFYNSESALRQHIAGINFSFNLLKLTSLMVSYEGTFDNTNTYHRYFITAIQRIKN